MGLIDFSITLLLTPVIFGIIIFHPVVEFATNKIQSSMTAVKGGKRKTGIERGHLILFAVDETSLDAVKWAAHEMIKPEDFVHIVHVLEPQDQMPSGPIYFTARDIEAVSVSAVCICINRLLFEQVSNVKGVIECCAILEEKEIKFDGRVMSSKLYETIDITLVNLISKVQPDLVLLGSSKRIGEYDLL